MTNQKKIMMQKSKTFCIIPWIHLHTAPTGVAAPCCISNSCSTPDGVGNTKDKSLMELVNSEKMNQLRLDMLSGIKNKECEKCYQHEEQGIKSFRQHVLEEFGDYCDESLENTTDDGRLKEFKMRYYDMRFNNICNFKCRTCGSEFSSQWEQENLKFNIQHATAIIKHNNKKILEDTLEQIDNMDTAYFAGGEPLITEEHYILLEEMIRKKRTNISLRYNTNLSNLRFKDKDILGLWKHFVNKIEVYASIDHYGKRAEYIRHGTNWDQIEENFHLTQNHSFINLQINTVLSVFNLLTIDQFYEYLLKKNFYRPKDRVYTLYPMSTPHHLSAHILPNELKELGKKSINRTISMLKINNFKQQQIEQLSNAIQWIYSLNTWEQQKQHFRDEVNRLDKIRGENFLEIFPELQQLIKSDKVKTWNI